LTVCRDVVVIAAELAVVEEVEVMVGVAVGAARAGARRRKRGNML
jgi:hypothetical protein